jgi:hypothetical protein
MIKPPYLALGLIFCLIFGIAVKNIGLGIALGVAIGVRMDSKIQK